MISEERRIQLLGKQLPVRVIPAQLPADWAKPKQEPGAHKGFRDLMIRDSHEAWIDGIHIPQVHNETLHHQHDGGGTQHVVVSSANRKALDSHLDSVKIWTKVTPSGPAKGPGPIHLQQLVDEAVHAETELSVADLLASHHERHVQYRELLGSAAAAVRDRAVAALEARLPGLVPTLLHAEDLDSPDLDAESLIDFFLRAKAKPWTRGSTLEDHEGHAAWLQDCPGSVLTRFGPVPAGHDLAFSIQDVGSVCQGQFKRFDHYYTPYSNSSQTVEEHVAVSTGKVNVWLNYANGDIAAERDNVTTSYETGVWAGGCRLVLYGKADSSTVGLTGTWMV